MVTVRNIYRLIIHYPCRQSSTGNSENTGSLSAFACHVLREICSQQWVLERCLSHPEELCDQDNLLDPLLSHSQAQRLLHMICYPDAGNSIDELDQKSMISRILEVRRRVEAAFRNELLVPFNKRLRRGGMGYKISMILTCPFFRI